MTDSILSTNEPEKLWQLGESHNSAYCGAKPFPHIVLDDFVDFNFAKAVGAEFPESDSTVWRSHVHIRSNKRACDSYEKWGPSSQQLINFFNGAIFLSFLEKLTGIHGLIPDPHYFGGGLHQTGRGGFLDVHADFNWHERLKLDRRINLLLYLTHPWEKSYGGELELWSKDMKRAEVKIHPLFNRCVIFNTTDISFHGHPEPLNTPKEICRNSIALYYYTNGRPRGEISAPHSTLYQKRPNEANAGVVNPGVLRRFVPPILFDWKQKIQNSLSRKD